MCAAEEFYGRGWLRRGWQTDGLSRTLIDRLDSISALDDIGFQADGSWPPVQLKEQATRVADCIMSVGLLASGGDERDRGLIRRREDLVYLDDGVPG